MSVAVGRVLCDKEPPGVLRGQGVQGPSGAEPSNLEKNQQHCQLFPLHAENSATVCESPITSASKHCPLSALRRAQHTSKHLFPVRPRENPGHAGPRQPSEMVPGVKGSSLPRLSMGKLPRASCKGHSTHRASSPLMPHHNRCPQGFSSCGDCICAVFPSVIPGLAGEKGMPGVPGS